MNQVNPIDLAIIQNRLVSIGNEMKRTMERCAFDPVIYEVLDFGCALLDRNFDTLAQGVGLALFIGSLGPATKNAVAHIGEENLEPGDIFVAATQSITGAHPPDAVLSAPIFHKDRLFGYASTKAHWLDLGAKDMYPTDSTDIFQEGLRIPPVKLYRAGILQKEIKEFILWNTRAPYQIWGDMHSQVSACRVAEKRVHELLDKFGLDYTLKAIQEMYDHGERMARAAIAEMPDGSWSVEDYLDNNGVDKEKPVKMKVTVTIDGEEMIIDYTGSAEEQKGPINCPLITTESSARLVMKALTTPDIPAHEGCFRPLKVVAPEGTLFNPGPMATTFLYGWPSMQTMDMVCRVMTDVVPEKVPAFSGGDLCGIIYHGISPRTGRFWAEASPQPIGQGADLYGDGESCLLHHSEGATRNVPIEVTESREPLHMEQYVLRQDSGGPGRNRGGMGMVRDYRYVSDGLMLGVIERGKFPHWGVKGGKPGARNYALVMPPGKEPFEVLKTPAIPIEAGTVISNRTGGGGGWGDPFEREAERVLDDVINEYVSVESARNDYGVEIKSVDGSYIVDEAETARLRGMDRNHVR